MGFFSVHPVYSAEDREAPTGAAWAFQGSSLSFTLTSMQWLHMRQFLHDPVIFLLAYRTAARNTVSHRNTDIKGAWEYVQADLRGVQESVNIMTVQSPHQYHTSDHSGQSLLF